MIWWLIVSKCSNECGRSTQAQLQEGSKMGYLRKLYDLEILTERERFQCSWNKTWGLFLNSHHDSMLSCCWGHITAKLLAKMDLGHLLIDLDKRWLHWINEFLRLNSPCGASALIWRVNSIALGLQTSAIFRHKFMLAHINFDVWIRITASLAILLVPRQLYGLSVPLIGSSLDIFRRCTAIWAFAVWARISALKTLEAFCLLKWLCWVPTLAFWSPLQKYTQLQILLDGWMQRNNLAQHSA